jgi:biotin carboxyl carrier protein
MKKNILVNDELVEVDVLNNSKSEISFIYNGKNYSYSKDFLQKVVSSHPTYVVNGKEIKVEMKTNYRTKKNIADHGQMIAPMPGKILKILVSEGTEVTAGTPILVMEAMKMEHTIKASKNGTVEKIHFKENSQVNAGAELVTLC